VPDDVLDEFVTIGLHDTIVQQLRARYQGLADSMEFSIPVTNEADTARLAEMVEELRR